MANNYKFLEGGGNMGELIRSFNWSKTPLGDPYDWPTNLKIATSLMLSTPFPMYIAWGSDYIQLYNDGYRPILGNTKHPQALGISSKETFSEIWHIIKTMFGGVMEGKAVGFPNFMLPLDRNGYVEECYFDFSYSPIRSETGEIGGVLVTVIETTDQVHHLTELTKAKLDLERAQAEVIRQRDRLHDFFMQAPAGICILGGPDLIFELANAGYQQLLPNRELLGKPIFEALPELIGQPIEKILRDTYATGIHYEAHELMVPIVKFEGGPLQDRYFNFVYKPRLNEHGAVDGIFAFVYEVTDTVQAKLELEKQKDKAQLAAIAAELGTFDMDLIKGTMDWDTRCRTLFGISHTNKVTYEKDFLPGLHPDDRERISKVINDLFDPKISNCDYDVEYRTIGVADQRLRWIRAKGKVFFKGDNPTRFIGSVLDITEQKTDEVRKNDFIGMVSHELKTPLTSLTAYLQVLLTRAKTNDHKIELEMLEKSNNQAKKMTALINGFLNISRFESGKMHMDPTRFNIDELIMSVIEDLKVSSNADIIMNLCAHVPIKADKDKIGSVITNLLTNAIKYSEKGRQIVVNCTKAEHDVTVEIIDEGIGIKVTDLPHLFDRYYRVENVNTKHISGFGIGLYLSAEIIKKHHGQIWAESELGKGSTFCFTLPVAENF
jgi:two-component system sensor histidine kinase VicK